MDARRVIVRIESMGGLLVRQKGSHRRYVVTYADTDGTSRTAYTTVPVHSGRDIPVGTLRGIQADLEPALGKGWLV